MRYAIAGNRLEKPLSANIEKGKVYWMGASASPDMILVTDITDKMVFYVRTYTAEWDDEPKVLRSEKWIFEDLVARAESTIRKEALRVAPLANSKGFDQIVYLATMNKVAIVGGMAYKFNHTRICNCCGTEMSGETCDDCGCANDYRENHSAEHLII